MVAPIAEQPVIANMLQLYIHDFSEIHAGTSRCDLSEDGRYRIEIPLADWWQEATHIPLLIRLEGQLAGFALLNARPHGGAPVDHNMAEFFVVRKYRRAGIGLAAAQQIFSRYPGRWEAAVMRRNTGARTFWQHAITTHPAVSAFEAGDSSDFTWDGTIFRFHIAPS